MLAYYFEKCKFWNVLFPHEHLSQVPGIDISYGPSRDIVLRVNKVVASFLDFFSIILTSAEFITRLIPHLKGGVIAFYSQQLAFLTMEVIIQSAFQKIFPWKGAMACLFLLPTTTHNQILQQHSPDWPTNINSAKDIIAFWYDILLSRHLTISYTHCTKFSQQNCAIKNCNNYCVSVFFGGRPYKLFGNRN